MSSEQQSPHSAKSASLPLSRRKKLLFALITLVAGLSVTELGLRLLRVEPAAAQHDPYVGFAGYSPLYTQQTIEGRRVMATEPNKLALFNPQSFSVDKPEEGYRIFCVGGSTTYGRPYDDTTSFAGWLREFLPVADPSRTWEVVNAGGVSYASYRVARVMEELADYGPDLFIIYSGHNEFLERRTYGDLLGTPGVIRDLGGLLSHSRTYAVIDRLLPDRRRPSSASSSLPMLPEEVATILDGSVGPSAYTRDDHWRRQVLEHYEFNLQRMIQIARGAGAEVVLVAPAANLKDTSPFKSEHLPTVTREDREQCEQLLATAAASLDADDAAAALPAVDAAVSIHDRYAQAHFERGRILLALGRPDDARAAFERARDEDVCPLRAVTEQLGIVARVAAERDVPLVDYQAIADEFAEDGIPGNEQFLDHVHPTIEGNRRLAEAILDVLIQENVVAPTPAWSDEAVARIAERVEGSLDERAHGIALRNLSKVLGWAGKIEEAGVLAERAVALAPDDPETQFQAGVACEDREDLAGAEVHYQTAIELDPKFVAAYLNLGVAQARQDKVDAAAETFDAGLARSPNSPVLLANRARVAALKGEWPTAVRYQRAAIDASPAERRAELIRVLHEYQAEMGRR